MGDQELRIYEVQNPLSVSLVARLREVYRRMQVLEARLASEQCTLEPRKRQELTVIARMTREVAQVIAYRLKRLEDAEVEIEALLNSIRHNP